MHHYLCDCLFIVIISLCWLVTLLMTLVTQLQQFFFVVSSSLIVKDLFLRDHIMLHLHLSVLLAQPQFKLSLLCRLNDESLKMFSPLIFCLFFELCIVWYNIQTILTTF